MTYPVKAMFSEDDIQLDGATVAGRIAGELGIKARAAVRAAVHTTFAIGGPMAVLTEPSDAEQAQRLVQWLNSEKVPRKVLGAGSNLLVDDRGVAACVIRLGRGFRYCRPLESVGEAAQFEVGAAMPLMSLCRELSSQGLTGLEFAGGIPASFGGAVRMNAGAHSGEISKLIKEITIISGAGEILRVNADDISFSYRHCGLPQDSLILSAVIELRRGVSDRCAELTASYLAERKARQPLSLPSAGSVFKNPAPDNSAGSLIENAGLKGHRSGGAQISSLHANWIVNPERKAASGDVTSLISLSKEKVFEHSGIELEQEVIEWVHTV
ncbi:MAG: UDP-N-acetylmuramate dehydrogenase [Deltaproteobacteria bacterium]|nr:UDP-N-acetylmuramate dehydrogenase [Deltaproteobacteria bacterium]